MSTSSRRILAVIGTVLLVGAAGSSGRPEPAPGTPGIVVRQDGPLAGPWIAAGEAPSIVPDQIVVKFQDSVTMPVERILERGVSFRAATTDRGESLDRLRARLGLRSARPIFRPAVRDGRPGKGLDQASVRLEQAERLESARRRFARRTARAVGGDVPDLSHVYVLTLAPGTDVRRAAAAFASDPHVAYAQPNYRATASFVPNDPYWASSGSWGQPYEDLWGLRKLRMEQAWDVTRGDDVLVAVVDTGLDFTHPDIASNVWSNPLETANGIDDDGNGFVDDLRGWDFANDDGDATDGHGHGTHVAGTIAAVGHNGIGIVGIAPNSRVMAVKGLDDGGSGFTDRLAAGIVYAAENGADAINNSWGCVGSDCASDPVVEDAVRTAHALGTVVVFAAGNSSIDVYKLSPQNAPEPIVVSASTSSDGLVFFSNYGAGLDVAAPGAGDNTPPPDNALAGILSLASATCPAMCQPEVLVGSGYVRLAGTSMAAPHVTGVAALVLAAHPSFTVEQVRQAIRAGSADRGSPGFDESFGHGRVDALGALAQAAPLEALITAPGGATMTAVTSVEVRGIAGGPGFESWKLEYGSGTVPASFSDIAGAGNPVSGVLLPWNISSVRDGIYTLRLTARNTSGQTYEDRQRIVIDNVRIDEPPQTTTSVFRGGSVITVSGTVAPADFVRYALVVRDGAGNVLGSANISLASGGLQPVASGVLGSWNTAGVPTGRYTISLEVTLSDASVITESSPVIVDPTLHPGWPVELGLFAVGGLTLGITDHLSAADVDLDGRADLVVGYGNQVWLFGDTGVVKPGWPQSVEPPGLPGHMIFKSPAIGDLTGDGAPEIVASTNGGLIFVWSSTGVALPGWPFGHGGGPNAVAVADVNGDGTSEIVTSDWGGRVDVLSLSGTSLPGWPRSLGVSYPSPPVIGDVDGDGHSEIAVLETQRPNRIFLLDDSSANRPGWPRTMDPDGPDGVSYSYPAMGELDGDPTREIVVGLVDGRVYALNADGTDVAGWPRQAVAGIPVNSPAIGDLDSDGRSEVVAGVYGFLEGGTRVNELHAWRGNGTIFPGWPVRYTGPTPHWFFGYGAAALADINGDGRTDVLASNEALDPLWAFGPDGLAVSGFPKPTVGTGAWQSNTVAVADLDGDGLLELGWIDFTGTLYVWDLAGPRTGARPWPMFHHDARHTGRSDPAEVPAAADQQTLAGSILSGSFVQTQVSDNAYEVLQTARINPTTTRLTHAWRFDNVPSGSHRLVIEAFRPTNANNDAFQFSWSTDNVTFTTIPGALVNSSTESRIEAPFGTSSTGRTLYVRVTNTVTAGAKNRTVNIDLLTIATAPPSDP